jgi:hypothetical protein
MTNNLEVRKAIIERLGLKKLSTEVFASSLTNSKVNQRIKERIEAAEYMEIYTDGQSITVFRNFGTVGYEEKQLRKTYGMPFVALTDLVEEAGYRMAWIGQEELPAEGEDLGEDLEVPTDEEIAAMEAEQPDQSLEFIWEKQTPVAPEEDPEAVDLQWDTLFATQIVKWEGKWWTLDKINRDGTCRLLYDGSEAVALLEDLEPYKAEVMPKMSKYGFLVTQIITADGGHWSVTDYMGDDAADLGSISTMNPKGMGYSEFLNSDAAIERAMERIDNTVWLNQSQKYQLERALHRIKERATA